LIETERTHSGGVIGSDFRKKMESQASIVDVTANHPFLSHELAGSFYI